MTTRPRLITSIPFWVLLVGSLAATVTGAWIAFTKVTTMVTGLTAQSATTADVYGGQSWIVIGGALLGAGLIGLIATLALAVLRALITPAPAVEVVEPIAFGDEDDLDLHDESAADASAPDVEDAPLIDAAIPAAPSAEERTETPAAR